MDRRIGFLQGVAAPFQGLGFVLRSPAIWPFAIVPVAVLLVVFAVVVALGVVAGGSAIEHWVHGPAWVALLLKIVVYAVVLLLSLVVAFALAQPLSSPALDRIVEAQDRALGIPAPPPEPAMRSLFRSLRVNLTSLAIALPLLLLLTLIGIVVSPATVVTVPLKFLVAALTVSWDMLDYPLGRHQLGVRERARWMREHPGATLGFGLALAALFLLPCLGLLLLPAGVAGATRLVGQARHAPPVLPGASRLGSLDAEYQADPSRRR